MWDVESGTCLYTITVHQDMINALEFSPKGELFASCSDDGLLVIWDSEVSVSKWPMAGDAADMLI